ncbi:MAG: PEP-CTERM sorting domain-containing protein [Planctomycetaceae bacterium]
MTICRKTLLCLLALAIFAAPRIATAGVNASLLIDIYQAGSDVRADIAGSFDYSSLVPQENGSSNFLSYSQANSGLFGFSNPSPSGNTAWTKWRIDEQEDYTTPFWGDGLSNGSLISSASSTTGTGIFLLEGNPLASPGTSEARIRLPSSYTSGDPINGSMTWANKTLLDLGLQGSGTWGWQDANGGTVTLRINAVPEPSTFAVAAGGIIGLLAVATRRLRPARG